ncbi:S-adenosyl-L-methionine-dependent methyltransferase [Daldinia loculata]|uniref:S-adenosyl-L-methionine-dependent methyltransferase n=1 Tax=Daldinia loculata TaxID=103429 RepID=UPI0020C3FFFA|nr:S-adenosyl-L-methionine-dependent methyltransferase [Daldinia loculata]KAI1652206.1 S-adenosyl-L-methionine-dependent methyltransferase [Daldinia loculata]
MQQQQQQQHQQEQAQKPDLGYAESESGMERRQDRGESSDDSAHLSASRGNSCSASASAVVDGTVPREAVTLTGGREFHHHHQQEVRHQRQPMHEAVPSTSTSTGSHGAAIRNQQSHVSSSTGTRINYPSSSPNATATAAAAAATITAVAATAMDANTTAESYEQQHVHSVYETIASHFSATRYKPWPFVASFLSSLPPGSVGLDVGCGNGKYLNVNRDIVIIGSDRSANLARLAQDLKAKGSNGADVAGVADGLSLPFGGARRVDFAICIAVVHHLSTRERRVEGLRALLDCVRPRSGKVLVYVWALEQGTSRRGWDETADQDQLVPWVMKPNKSKKEKAGEEASNKKENNNTSGASGASGASESAGVADATYQRYYHLYRKGELEEDAQAAGGEIVESGYEKDNWWVIASPKEESSSPSIGSR